MVVTTAGEQMNPDSLGAWHAQGGPLMCAIGPALDALRGAGARVHADRYADIFLDVFRYRRQLYPWMNSMGGSMTLALVWERRESPPPRETPVGRTGTPSARHYR